MNVRKNTIIQKQNSPIFWPEKFFKNKNNNNKLIEKKLREI